MHEDCKYCVKRNICTRDVPKPCRYRYTEDERKADQASDQCGVILSAMYLPKTYQKEEDKMNATSTETFHDIIAIDFELQAFPSTGEQDKFIVTARNRDDIFAFEFNGPCLVEACRKAGLLTGWEKDQKIRKLEEINKNLKKHVQLQIDNSNDILKSNDKLREMNEELKEENEKLKQLKTPTIENFADEEPSSRRDILRCAEKCVCGHREQDYGTPESNFQLIADLWNNYLGITDYVLDMEQRFIDLNEKGIKVDVDFPKPKTIFPEDVAMMMALLKIARIRNGGGSGDSFVDLAGYAACGGEIWAGQKHQKDLN